MGECLGREQLQDVGKLDPDRTVWTSADGVSEWTPHKLETAESLLALTCAPDNSLWVAGSYSTLLNSSDGGNSWDEQSLEEDAQLSAIQFVDESTGFAAGEFGLIAKTTDGGLQWEVAGFIPDEFYPQGVWFRNAEQGWVTGLSGTIMRTDDGGANWEVEESSTAAPLYQVGLVQLKDQQIRYALGDHSTLLLSQAASGSEWGRSAVSRSPLYFADALQVDGALVIVGGGGAVHRIDLAQLPAGADINLTSEGGM